MPLNSIEAVNSAATGSIDSIQKENVIKTSIFDYKIENTKNNENIFLNKNNGKICSKQTFDWAEAPDCILKQANFKEQLKNIEKENNAGFFSTLKDFIMNFGDVTLEEFYF